MVKSPLLRVGEEGEINLSEGRLNYLARTTIVASLEGQGGQDLASLRGLTIPIRAAGPFSAVKYTLDLNALGVGVVKQRIEEKKEEVKKQLQEKLGEGLQRLFR